MISSVTIIWLDIRNAYILHIYIYIHSHIFSDYLSSLQFVITCAICFSMSSWKTWSQNFPLKLSIDAFFKIKAPQKIYIDMLHGFNRLTPINLSVTHFYHLESQSFSSRPRLWSLLQEPMHWPTERVVSHEKKNATFIILVGLSGSFYSNGLWNNPHITG